MPTRAAVRAESMRRLGGGFETLTVALDADISDSAAQRKIVTSDRYSVEATSPHLGQAFVWAGRSGDGSRVKQNTYVRVTKASLVPPSTSNYTLKIYGYGETVSLTPTSTAAAIETAIHNANASLASVTVAATGTDGAVGCPYTIGVLPSADTTIELVRATPSDATGSVSQGLCSFEILRPLASAPMKGDTIELLTRYPAHDEPGLTGMNTLINQALARLWLVRILHFVSNDETSQQVTFSLAEHPFLRTRRQVIRAYAPTTWRHDFAFTVPGVSFTLTVDAGLGTDITTVSINGSANSAVIEEALRSALGAAGVVGTVDVTANGSTRTVTVADAVHADMALAVSSGATVTTTRERTEMYRFVDGFRLRYEGSELVIEWDRPWQRGYTWYLEVYQPADTYVARQLDYQTVGTAWETVTDGLEADLDQCVPDLLEVAAVVHYLACRQLALKGGGGQETVYWRGEAARAAQIAAQIKSLDLPSGSEPGFRDEGLVADRSYEDKGFWTSGWGW